MLWWTLRGLKSPDPEVRKQTAQTAGASGKHGAVPRLIDALSDGDSTVRAAIMEALGSLRDPRAVEPLAAFLKKPGAKEKPSKPDETQDCPRAAMALAQFGEPAFAPLVEALRSGSKEVRRASALALGTLRDPRALEPLAQTLNDARSEVRQAAALALGELGERGALKQLASVLAHKDPETRRTATEAVGKLGGAEAVPLLAQAVEDREEDVQMAAIEALKTIGGAKAALSLKPAVHATKRSVRDAASSALKRMPFPATNPEERAALAVLMQDFAGAAREGEAAVPSLSEALSAPEPQFRRGAASALEGLHSVRAVPALIRALRDHDSEVREIAARALAALGPEAVTPLIEVVGSHDVTAQQLAARALGQIGDTRAVGPLADCIVANGSARDYLEPLEAARAARDALAAILSRCGNTIPADELLRISSVPDPVREFESGDRQVAVDCTELRTLSRLELEKK